MSRASSAQAAAAAVPVRRNTTLFVDGLAESFASGDLTALFAQYGQVVEGEVFVDNDNVSRGFGFVTMHSTEAAARAKAELDLKTLPGVSPGRPLKVRWALDKGTLYVGDLGPDVTGDQLQEVRAPAASSHSQPTARVRARPRACAPASAGVRTTSTPPLQPWLRVRVRASTPPLRPVAPRRPSAFYTPTGVPAVRRRGQLPARARAEGAGGPVQGLRFHRVQ